MKMNTIIQVKADTLQIILEILSKIDLLKKSDVNLSINVLNTLWQILDKY